MTQTFDNIRCDHCGQPIEEFMLDPSIEQKQTETDLSDSEPELFFCSLSCAEVFLENISKRDSN